MTIDNSAHEDEHANFAMRLLVELTTISSKVNPGNHRLASSGAGEVQAQRFERILDAH